MASVATPTSIPEPSLRQRTTHGVMWNVAQALATRGVTLLQQMALAWLLAKEDFGLIGLTYTVTSFVTLMSNPGIDSVLIQRQKHFRIWTTPAFWMALTMGSVSMIAMLALAPAAAWAYGQPRLIGMIDVLAIALPIQAVQMISQAQLQSRMRYRTVALIGLLSSVLTAILTVTSAFSGLGAYSFVIPIPVVSAIIGAVTWWLARPAVRWNLSISRWKYLVGNSAGMGGTRLLHTVSNQGDYIALGLAGFSDAAIGSYVFAFNAAIQALRLLATNVPAVLFPSLSQLIAEPVTQVRATLRAMRLLALIVVPFCIWQVLMARPLFHLIFPARWHDAVLPYQLLTIGLMFNASCWPAQSLLMAQGRFREYFLVTLCSTLFFFLFVGGALWIYPSIVSVAAGVAAWHFLNSPVLHWAGTRHHAPALSYYLETYRPLVSAALATLPCIVLQLMLPIEIIADLTVLAAGTTMFAATYFLLLFKLAPAELEDLRNQVAPLFAYIRRIRQPKPTEVA
jgi:O-antigen/teichoic acid export membrane protein